MNFFGNNKTEDEIFMEKALKSTAELLEHMDSTVRLFLHHCEKYGIIHPHGDQIRKSIDRSQELLRKLPSDYQVDGDKFYKNYKFSLIIGATAILQLVSATTRIYSTLKQVLSGYRDPTKIIFQI